MASLDAIAARFDAIPAPLQGALMMTGAALGFSLMTGLIRLASASLDPLQIVFFRNFFALLFMLPWLLRVGPGALSTPRLPLHFARAAVGFVAMACWFTSVALLPLAQAVSLNFTVPLFATAGAALVLGEVVRARRWTATVVGFLGVLVIVRPGLAEVSPATALPVVAALFMAGAALIVKTLSRSENPSTMVFYMNFFLTPMSLAPALFVWVWPDWITLGTVVLIGLLAMLSHQLLTRAFARADASAVIPFQYARLPFVALIGFLFFGETPDLWTFLGAGIIAAAAVYIAHREAVAARQRGEAAGSARDHLVSRD